MNRVYLNLVSFCLLGSFYGEQIPSYFLQPDVRMKFIVREQFAVHLFVSFIAAGLAKCIASQSVFIAFRKLTNNNIQFFVLIFRCSCVQVFIRCAQHQIQLL